MSVKSRKKTANWKNFKEKWNLPVECFNVLFWLMEGSCSPTKAQKKMLQEALNQYGRKISDFV